MVWKYDEMPSLAGKVAIVTGATGGIGLVTASKLAAKGATVVVPGRNIERAEDAAEKIRAAAGGNGQVVAEVMDQLDLKSVEEFAKRVAEKYEKLDILVNNAGIMAVPFALSKDGIESQWAVNHFSHFLLSARLFPLLLKSPEPRVICVSSVGHKLLGPKSADVSYDLEKINDPKLYPWNEFKIYGETKAANILFARGLQRKFDASDKTAYVNTCHPGNIATDLGSKTAYSSRILTWLSNLFLITPEQGALTQTYLASSPDVVEKGYKGEYFVPYAQLSRSTAATEDKGLQEKLWKWSEDVLRSKGFEV